MAHLLIFCYDVTRGYVIYDFGKNKMGYKFMLLKNKLFFGSKFRSRHISNLVLFDT
jgi:hypothetical protein